MVNLCLAVKEYLAEKIYLGHDSHLDKANSDFKFIELGAVGSGQDDVTSWFNDRVLSDGGGGT